MYKPEFQISSQIQIQNLFKISFLSLISYWIFVAGIFVFVLYFTTSAKTQELGSNDMCYQCHLIIEGKYKEPAVLYKNDIHFRKSITCAACHGGDASNDDQDKAMSKDAGFIGIPSGSTVTRICAKCHGKEYNTLMASVHGPSEGRGPVINNCVSCHGVHNIVPVKSAGSKVNGSNIVSTCGGCHSNASFIKNYNPKLPVDQLQKYKTSVHGQRVFKGDAKVATCASCHGNHDVKRVKDLQSKVYFSNIPTTCAGCHSNKDYMKGYKIPTTQYEDYKSSVHGIALLEKDDRNAPSCNRCHGDHGASPPEVESITKVCGICHALNEQIFAQSPHQQAFEKNNLRECVECHGNHKIVHPTEEMLGDGEGSVCVRCHKDNDKGIQLSRTMKIMFDSLNQSVNSAYYYLNRAEQLGMDISDAKFDSSDITKVVITSRNNVHYSSLDKFKESIDEGFKITGKAKTEGEQAVKEYYFRRAGFAISTFFITILMISLYLKLKKIERKNKKPDAGHYFLK